MDVHSGLKLAPRFFEPEPLVAAANLIKAFVESNRIAKTLRKYLSSSVALHIGKENEASMVSSGEPKPIRWLLVTCSVVLTAAAQARIIHLGRRYP